MDSGLSLIDISLKVLSKTLFRNLTCKIEPGSCCVIMGPSGCGKSSLINFVCGTIDDSFSYKGNIFLDGRSLIAIPTEKRQLGILFQDDLLFPHLSVGENIALALPHELTRRERRDAIHHALERIQLPDFEDRDPMTLSSGQRIRVALMRCLSAQPKALLLDEPFSKLNQDLRDDIRSQVFELCRTKEIPCLLVTHDEKDAEAVLNTMPKSHVKTLGC